MSYINNTMPSSAQSPNGWVTAKLKDRHANVMWDNCHCSCSCIALNVRRKLKMKVR